MGKKVFRYAKSKGVVTSIVCARCGSSNAEQVTRKEIDTPKRITWLCYSCGEGQTVPKVE